MHVKLLDDTKIIAAGSFIFKTIIRRSYTQKIMLYNKGLYNKHKVIYRNSILKFEDELYH